MSIFGADRAIFFAAHTDDEMVCAGTLHRLIREGCQVMVVAFCQCAERGDTPGLNISKRVEEEFRSSMGLIGAMMWDCAKLVPSSRLREQEQNVSDTVHLELTQFKPDLVISLSPHDDNPAHSVVGDAVRRVARGRVDTLLECHFPWNTEPDVGKVYVSLSPEDVEVKRKVIQTYQSQAHRYSYEHLLISAAVVYGESVKVRHAERFNLVRSVI